jgi:hypothetical protein
MTQTEIDLVKEKAPYYESFIEAHSNGKIDIQIDIQVLNTPISIIDGNLLVKLNAAQDEKYRPEKNYDSCIFTADYTGINAEWRAINWGFYMLIPFRHTGSGWAYEGDIDYHTNLYVHEWCHQLESYFPSIDSAFQMPVLHNDTADSAYTDENTGLSGEARLSKWYADYIQGTIVHYPGATNTYKGVNADWWQYHPLWRIGGMTTTPLDGATGVSTSPAITISWPGAVESIFNPSFGYFFTLRNGDDVELGFYYAPLSAMSADKTTLGINWPSVTRVSGQALAPLSPGTRYHIRSYQYGYAYTDASCKYKTPNFDISFTTAANE